MAFFAPAEESGAPIKILAFSTLDGEISQIPFLEAEIDKLPADVKGRITIEYLDGPLGFPMTAENEAVLDRFFAGEKAEGELRVTSFFTQDRLPAENVEILRKKYGVDQFAMRCAGYDRVDIKAVFQQGITMNNCSGYSPISIAEHALALTLACSRFDKKRVGKLIKDMTIGIVGTGRIGLLAAEVFHRNGCKNVFGFDLMQTQPWFDKKGFEAAGGRFVDSLDELLAQVDVVSFHCNVTPEMRGMLNAAMIGKMKPGTIIVNTARSELFHEEDMLAALGARKVSLGTDVYETFRDKGLLEALEALPNTAVTYHIAYRTGDALRDIARMAIENIVKFATTDKIVREIPEITKMKVEAIKAAEAAQPGVAALVAAEAEAKRARMAPGASKFG